MMKQTVLVVLLLTVLSVVSAGCGSGGSNTLTSGIAGTVFEGPITPVSMAGQPNEKPYPGAVLQIQRLDGTAVATAMSGQDGTYSVQVPPGQYQVVPLSGQNGFPHASPLPVTVQANSFTTVDVHYDTGIR